MSTIQRTSIGLLMALALGAGAAPALAGPFNVNSHGSIVPAGGASLRSPVAKTEAVSTAPVIVRVAAPSGFDWGDAGIGAAGGIALAMIGLGGALAVSQNRARRTRRTTAVPS